MKRINLEINNIQASYVCLGHGKKNMLIFKGIGQKISDFERLSLMLPKYTLFCIEISNIVKNPLNTTKTITIEEFQQITAQLLTTSKIDKFTVLGCSFGAKLAYSIIIKFASQIEKIILIAPETPKGHPAYRISQTNALTRWILKQIFKKYKLWIIFLVMFNKNLATFLKHNLKTKKKQKIVFNLWAYFRNIKLNNKQVASLIEKQNIPTIFIIGKQDKIISPLYVKNFQKHIKHSNLIEIKARHSNLLTKIYPNITKII